MSLIQEHLDYADDPQRIRAFRQAIDRLVHDNDVVLDLGCGTGLLGLMCLEAGARHVYAVDRSLMNDVARETFRRAGHAEHATVLCADSSRVTLPEQVHVVIADQVGFFGFDYGLLEQYQDARERLLRPGGTLIPHRLRLTLAAVESPHDYSRVTRWTGPAVPEGLHWIRELAANTKYSATLDAMALLTEAVELADIDLYADNPPYLSWTIDLRVQRAGLLHGLGGWFECELAPGVTMTNSPCSPSAIKRPQAFFPMCNPLFVDAGDVLHVTMLARPAERQLSWIVELPSGQQLRHSTWEATQVEWGDLQRSLPTHVPRLTPLARAHQVVLNYCDGRRSLGEIREAIRAEHPDLLPSAQAIEAFVTDVLRKETT